MREAGLLTRACAHPGALLAAATLVVLPFGRIVEGPVLLMAALGLWRLLRRRGEVLREPAARALTLVFLCAWIPVLISLIDAVSPQRTAMIALNHLRFWLSGLFLVAALAAPGARRLFMSIAAAVIALWVADALVQLATGRDLLGYEAWPRRLGAVFGPDNTKFGLTLAVLAPLLWHETLARFGRAAAVTALGLSVWIVLLASSRAGWIAVLVAGATWLVLRAGTSRRALRGVAAAIVVVTVAGGATAYSTSERVRTRIDQALAAFDAGADHHSSIVHRIWIWGGALRMFSAHPINGVGARGFRDAFARFARPDDPYLAMDPPQHPTHSHQLLIEVATETGVIGLGGLALMWVLLARLYLGTAPGERRQRSALAACLVAAYFPLNSHLAIYSAYWSQIVWLLIGLYCALGPPAGKAREASSAPSASRTRAAENQRS